MEMSTKIQINSLEALERLIGNDNELEIEIRNSVVQNFTKKHLKDVANGFFVKSIAEAVKNEIRDEFFENKSGLHMFDTFFKKDVLEKLGQDLKYKARLELLSVVADAIEEQKIKETIKEKLDSAVVWVMQELAPQKLENGIEKLVEARLKEKLGIK